MITIYFGAGFVTGIFILRQRSKGEFESYQIGRGDKAIIITGKTTRKEIGKLNNGKSDIYILASKAGKIKTPRHIETIDKFENYFFGITTIKTI